MLSKIIAFSVKNKILIFLFTALLIGFGLYSATQISIGAVPDITNNQVQVITTSKNLSTQDMEQFITYPIELEMANLPGVQEIRSDSKFGLSVVTIVFDDDMGTYLPRQLIAEKIQTAAEKIPEGFGTPEMGPISTGLGEIYQYILDVKPEFKDRYTDEQLRTFQDWIVKRQLSGIPGVVEVNTWGGHLKQYEVAINTQKLAAMNVTAREVFTALENNNSVAGGGYIEKVNQAYFIRGEGLIKNLEDIKNVVVKKSNGRPIYIRDVAEVGYGSATRFGAITANGEGEKVLGQVMMLKDADSKKVIDAVKERVAEISKTLPEGVYINPFLERSELIGKTMNTVVENLVFGFLIVIFVVVILLGNLRSGLVVASVIPLSLLFALSMMHIFGVDANLMSMGAIDFGIIIDGAVIIVEFTTFKMMQNRVELQNVPVKDRQNLKDEISFSGASTMMNSAIFGQLIILIVFIPILTLQGVEGKMFRPMALVFSFALIGAMILCLTYVPVVSALFLKPKKSDKPNFSDKVIKRLQAWYLRAMNSLFQIKYVVLGFAFFILMITVFVFTRMGGEFIPQLDENDFVIQPVLKTGTSLQKTIETTTRIEKILIEQFPEVNQVVTRIGAAEVPTDPMSMEESDVIITMKPKSEWTSASNRDEMANKFEEALSVIPGMEVEFTQPIEMRFNELITGVRADIAIKVFGDDLSILAKKGEEIKALVENVEGASDVVVDKIEGLPQMNVSYNRHKIARYGLNIADVNDVLSMAFGGKIVGNVFEGERSFDLVVRLGAEQRKDIDDIKNLMIDLPIGGKLPMSELAEISYTKGAARISRDDTKRRMVVGVNVRDRDLQSVAEEIQELVDNNIDLPIGYSVDFGGQFENLQSASKRLMLAVPISLLLIFVLLYFAFRSVKEALMIYSAIPLAAVGGVLLLWMRDLPFSISAGVGFIALFGIAVLNGIVLIEHFKELKIEKFKNLEELIKQGAQDRMRAVLLTASAAMLGFLPMAISTGAGAEVQRPLATVVIGGLITSTFLTLIVLPILYSIFMKNRVTKIKVKPLVSLLFLLVSIGVMAQEKPMNLEELQIMALQNNLGIQSQHLRIDEAEALIGTYKQVDKTHIYLGRDQNNLGSNNKPMNVIGAEQDISLGGVFKANKKLKEAEFNLVSSQLSLQEKQLKKAVTLAYYQFLTEKHKENIYAELDSLYAEFSHMAELRYELGESNYLEKITASTKQRQVHLLYEQALIDGQIAYQDIQKWVQAKDSLKIEILPLKQLIRNELTFENTPEMQILNQQSELIEAQLDYEKKKKTPDLTVELFNSFNLDSNQPGFQVGVKIPFFNQQYQAQFDALEIGKSRIEIEKENLNFKLNAEYQNLLKTLNKHNKALVYYEEEGLVLANEIVKTADKSFLYGEIDFFQYIQSMENAYQIKIDYLNQLNLYNQTIIQLNNLTYDNF